MTDGDLSVIAWRLQQVEVQVKEHTLKLEHMATQEDISRLSETVNSAHAEMLQIAPKLIQWFIATAIAGGLLVVGILSLLVHSGVLKQ